ncbi:MerR family transcriptional regulator [Bariatricus massiliensis]|uniref:MerR family transcriptional regulator n=1 Tax=Bariatricus massiliensis TaxID=1745713 RepID=A0ABS8DKH2_9FIRM|nr:MerR family transcriptional regulator [Bariatricus massiliensis]MCB7305729.1 MerR family transcriptional regulator [Bariatricus massiliensis]MCB7376354.1 MerR family transcriptional regulator [Bariatricus massiliensis]MCB7388872.1 MerR family transcriptional regulator [Bariatricus massiliensis]MCB7413045.1 MerR family transcriptional regulator [Bariatricus massiliensis]MCQ5255010.1 MerR family transcriptional regulator [Bariatricus massiliensis]
MLSIGEFSNICKVSAKTLRYYAEIGLLLPEVINPENGYRYYSIEQLEKMLLINRLKSYHFTLEEIKGLLERDDSPEKTLYLELLKKKRELEKQLQDFEKNLDQLKGDIAELRQGKSLLSYLEHIDVRLVEVPTMYLLSIRKMVQEDDFPSEYRNCFGRLFRRITEDKLTISAPPMVLFHSSEYTPTGLDTEFAIPIKEFVTGTRDFRPGLCLKTVVYGSYSNLTYVYTRQCEWAEKEGYENTGALYEVYVTDPSQVSKESELITEVYYPVKKRPQKEKTNGTRKSESVGSVNPEGL